MILVVADPAGTVSAFEARRRNPVNLLRGAAVSAVVVHHLAVYEGTAIPYLSAVGGQFGVQLFFLISGFLLAQSAGRRTWAHFLAGRAVRILPCYWVALCVAGWLLERPQLPAHVDEVLDFVANALALGHLRPYGLFRFDTLFVSWTLTIEWTWYLALPALAWWASRCVSPMRFWLTAAVVTAVLGQAWVMSAQSGLLDGLYAEQFRRITDDPGAGSALRTAFITVAAPAQWAFFVLGALLSVAAKRLTAVPAWGCLAVALLLLVDPARTAAVTGADPTIATGLGLAALFVLVLRMPSGARWLKPVHWLGDVSYPVYLLHVPVTMWVVVRMPPGGTRTALVCTGIAVAAVLLHRIVELPTRAMGARLAARGTSWDDRSP